MARYWAIIGVASAWPSAKSGCSFMARPYQRAPPGGDSRALPLLWMADLDGRRGGCYQAGMDSQKTARFMESIWDNEIIPALTDYIRIPNKSPAFDPSWEQHGHMEQ